MNTSRLFLVSLLLGVFATSAFGLDEFLFHHTDSLAQRDEWGLLTQGPLNPTDFERRYPCRFIYYPISGRELSTDTAYVGALQTALRRKGYYSGPIDGAFSDEVAAAICRMQKAHAMRVNGRLTVPVRRALFLP